MKECLQCGLLFKPRTGSIYCSSLCGSRFRNQKYRDSHREAIKVKNFKDNSDSRKRVYTRAKSRAKQFGIPFNISVEDIIVPDICPVLGIPIVHHQGRKGYHPNSPSIDKIDPGLGYVKGNVRMISARANLLKNNASIEELEAVLKDLKRLKCVN